ncbi:MAG: DoxX family protein [Bacteroidia bacterium]|nr:DoxX family protein [Bacteroidia bacterium]
MKKDKIIYWSTTGLFAAFMAFTAIPDILKTPETVEFIKLLGYPEYFIPFIGVAKLVGSIAILIPQFKKIKEWAYAGLAFDLIGAMYSVITVHGFDPGMTFMIPIFALMIISYIYNNKLFSH